MGIEQVYGEKLAQEVLLDILRDGRIPSLAELEGKVDEIADGRSLAKPLFDLPTAKLTEKEVSSAAKQNTTANQIKRDLCVLYAAAQQLAFSGADIFDRTTAEMRLLLAKIAELETRLSSLLLIRHETGGYFNYVYDNFQNMLKVDQVSTTALIDLRATRATAFPIRGIEEDIGAVPIPGLGEALTPFAKVIVGNEALVVRSGFRGGFIKAFDMVTNNDTPAIYQVVTSEPVPIGITMGIWFLSVDDVENFLSENNPDLLEATKIVLDPHLTNVSGPLVVSIRYIGTDGNPHNLPTPDFVKEVSRKTSWNFARSSLAGIQINMTKVRPDEELNGQYTYNFGINYIEMFNQSFRDVQDFAETELVSSALSATDRNGAAVEFNKVALDACEVIPPNTQIDYFVDFGVAGTFSDTWSPISPVQRTNPSEPQVVFMDRVTTGAAVDSVALLTTDPRGPGTALNFRYYQSDFNRALGTTFSSVANSVDLPTEWEIWRNTFRITDNLALEDTSMLNVEAGWRFDGLHYSCVFYVAEEGGRTIDFGPADISVDGVPRSGIVRFNKGVHRFKTHRNNWATLNGLNNITSFDPLTNIFTGGRTAYDAGAPYSGLGGGDNATVDPDTDAAAGHTELDPLYPYNHKLLVEGLDYNAGFALADRLYVGVTRVAAELMIHVSNQDFINNVLDDDLTRWTDVTIIDDTAAGAQTERPVMKIHLNNILRERFTTVRKYKSGTLATEIKLRAVFKTQDSSITPCLDAYMLKLAH